jgi:hypothetical protein
MKVRRHNSLNSLLATLLVVVAAAGCVEPIDITPPEVTDDVELTFQIAIPSAGIMTKAENIAAVENESKIYDLQVWAFTNGGAADETAVGYGHMTSTDGSISTITMKLPSRVVNGENPKLDFYALANGPSVGFTAVKYPPRSTSSETATSLQDATFGKNATATPVTDYFGATTPTSAVPETGLPMACYSAANFEVSFLRYGLTKDQLTFIKDHPNQQDKPEEFSQDQWNYFKNKWDYNQLCPTLDLKRSIAKIRFVFAKAESMSEDVQITSIKLVDGSDPEDMLPVSTYLFPRETGSDIKPSTVGYESFSWTGDNVPLVAASSFKHPTDASKDTLIDTPLRLRKDSTIPTGDIVPNNLNMQEYENFLTAQIALKQATERILYLRESDKSDVKCKITYKIGDNEKDALIAIPAGAKLARNTWWTVYAYFISYELGFQVTVAPWDGIGSSPNDNSHMQ